MTFAPQPTAASDETIFYEALAKSAGTFFRDPLTDHTYRRQTSLLVVSILSLLLALAVVKLGDVTLSGVKLTIDDARDVKYVLSAITLYFAVVYALSAYQDLKAYGYSELAAESALMDLQARLEQEFALRVADVNAGLALTGEAIAKRSAAIEEYRARTQPLHDELAELRVKWREDPLNPAIRDRMHAIDQQLDLERRDRPQPDDGLEELQDEVTARAFDRTTTTRMEALLGALQGQRQTSRARQWVEVVAPVVFAALSIALVWATR